jgi:hypothetical protein
MTRNPGTYSEERNGSCVLVQLIGHGKSASKWTNKESHFACDACTNSDRLCVRIRSMADVSTGDSLNEFILCIFPLDEDDRLSEDWDDAGFWRFRIPSTPPAVPGPSLHRRVRSGSASTVTTVPGPRFDRMIDHNRFGSSSAISRYLARASTVWPAATGSASLPLLPRYLARASIVLSIAAVSASLPRIPLGLAPCPPRTPLSPKASDASDMSVSSSVSSSESSADVRSSLRLLTNTSYVDASGSASMMGTRRNRSWIRLTTRISLRLSTDEGSLGTTCCLYVSDVSITTDLDCYLHLSKLQVRRGLEELEQRLQEGYERAW